MDEDEPDGRMDPGELQMVREALGLTGEHLASMLSVNPRTLRAWEAGHDPIPERVREEVEQIEQDTSAAVGELVAALQDAPDPAVLVYRTDAALHAARPDMSHLPARWWRHVVYRATEQVPGVRVVTHTTPPQRDMIGLGVRTFHYRIYGPAGEHLYSGSTTDVRRRLQEHLGKRWLPRTGLDEIEVEIEEYTDRWMALLAERRSGRGVHGLVVETIGKVYLSKVPEDVRARILAWDIPEPTSITRTTLRKALGR